MDKGTKNNLYDVNSWVDVFSGLFGSVVDKTRNNLYDDKSCVHKFSGAFGSVVDKRTRNNLQDVLDSYHIFSGNRSTISEHLISNQSRIMKMGRLVLTTKEQPSRFVLLEGVKVTLHSVV